jgi:hypothetical protein
MIKTVIQFMKRFHIKFCSFFILIVLPFFIFQKGYGQYLIPDLTFSNGSIYSEYTSKIILDEYGNLYHIGSYGNSPYIQNNVVTTFGPSNIIISKFDPYGTFLWGKTIAYSSKTKSFRDIVLHKGKFYICAQNSDTLIFLNKNIEQNDTLIAKGVNDFYIAQLSVYGDLLSYKSYESELYSSCLKIDILNDNIVIAGTFYQMIKFDPQNPTPYNTILSANQKDIFLACIDTNYNVLWAKRAGGNENDVLKDMIVYDQFIYITGSFMSNMNFNTPSSFNSNVLTSYGPADMYVAKYDQFGNPIWYYRGGSLHDGYNEYSSRENAISMCANKHGIYIIGNAEDDAIFNGRDTTISVFEGEGELNEGFLGLYMAHYTHSGNLKYVKDLKGYFYIKTPAISATDHYIVVSSYIISNFTEYSSYYHKTFEFNISQSSKQAVRLFDYKGTFITGATCGSSSSEEIINHKIFNNKIYLSGRFAEKLSFCDFQTPISQLISRGSNDFFIARYPFPEFIKDSIIIPEYTFQLYPNPVENQFTITLEQVGQKYAIYDISGKLMQEGVLLQYENQINISHLKAGIYMVKIMADKPKIIKILKY